MAQGDITMSSRRRKEKSQIIETNRLILREVVLGDAEAIFKLFNDSEVMKYFTNTPNSIKEAQERIQRDIKHYIEHGFGFWATVLKDTGRIIGQCGLLAQIVDEVNEIEIGYALAEQSRKHGYATEATKAIKNYSFNELNLTRLISIINPNNSASKRVALRTGLAFEKTTTWMNNQVEVYSAQKI